MRIAWAPHLGSYLIATTCLEGPLQTFLVLKKKKKKWGHSVLGELPKLFGRNFAVGFLLPAAVLIPAALWVAGSFDERLVNAAVKELAVFRTELSALSLTVFLSLLWLAGVLLLALNTVIIRLKEGYGSWNPAVLWKSVERRRFEKHHERLRELNREYVAGLSGDSALREARREEGELLAVRFPDREDLVLPTAFGNTIRAFEVYPRVIYGLDSIPAWPRLLMVMPEESRALIETAKAQMDFWVNVWFLSLLIFGEYIALVLIYRRAGNPWALMSVVLALGASNRARAAAAEWGETIKAAFDVYLLDLRDKLGLEQGLDREAEKQQWTNLSVAMIFRRERSFPPRRRKIGAGSEDEKQKTG